MPRFGELPQWGQLNVVSRELLFHVKHQWMSQPWLAYHEYFLTYAFKIFTLSILSTLTHDKQQEGMSLFATEFQRIFKCISQLKMIPTAYCQFRLLMVLKASKEVPYVKTSRFIGIFERKHSATCMSMEFLGSLQKIFYLTPP